MITELYIKAVNDLFTTINQTQSENMEKAAELIAVSVKGGANVHVFDTGHIIDSELINRAGGLAILKSIKYVFTVDDPVRAKDQTGKSKSLEGLGMYVLRQSNVMPGDVLILGSVSGKTVNVIDLAIEAKKMGVKTIVITAIAYSSLLNSDHSSGKHLYELGDVVIDNCAPKGDAMIEVEGLDNKFGPASGLSAAYILWQTCARVVEKLLALDAKPTVYKSVNFPNGMEQHEKLCKRYEELGI